MTSAFADVEVAPDGARVLRPPELAQRGHLAAIDGNDQLMLRREEHGWRISYRKVVAKAAR